MAAGITYGDTVDEMDFAYLARVTRLNVMALAALARAPLPPAPVAEAAVRTDTLIRWPAVSGAALYQLFARRTDAPGWGEPIALVTTETPSHAQPGTADAARIFSHTAALRGDDWFFGVSACAADGVCSPVGSAVPGGAFAPLAPAQGDNR